MKPILNVIRLYFLALLLFCNFMAKAQSISQDELSEKIFLNGRVTSPISLFVHFDKTIYTNNETVWFTGYLNKSNLNDIAKHNVLSVALVRDVDSLIIKHDKYLINNGISFGMMVLPDSMLTGNYHFQVSTNRVSKGKPDVVFIQPIVIKTNIDPAINASIKLLEKGLPGRKPNQLLVSVTTRDSRLLPQPAEVTYQYGNVFKKAKTNSSGELVFSLYEQPILPDQNVYVRIKYDSDTSFLNYPISVTVKKAKIKFYPEGGNMIVGITGKVAWEATDQQGAPVALKAILFKNKKAIDTIETNSYGIGKFILKPESGNDYTVKLWHTNFADSSFYLPVVLHSGVSLSVKAGTVKDTLRLNLLSTTPRKIALRLHDYTSTYFIKEYNLKEADRAIEIPLTDVPKGLKEITVFDSLGRPLAERLIFSHYNNDKKINVTTDQEVYGKRNKVTLKLCLNGLDTLGFVSIACVQSNRLSSAIEKDIETYSYLNDELSTLPIPANGTGYQDKEYVENILLTKGWRRYTWTDILKMTARDTIKTYDTLAVKIKVTNKSDKDLRKPVDLIIMRDRSPGVGNTGTSGKVALKDEDLLIEYGKKINVFVGGKSQKDYTIKVIDPYENLNNDYVKFLHVERLKIPIIVQNNNEMTLKSDEREIRLKEVKITSRNDNSLNYAAGGMNGKGIEYYIIGCPYNIPNCPRHSPGEHIISKVDYDMYLRTGGSAYSGLVGSRDRKFSIPVAGIYTTKEFYINEYKDKLEPAFVSTLYWNHGSLLNTRGNEYTFFTGDITGKFKVIVQGISDNDLLYGAYFFEVKDVK